MNGARASAMFTEERLSDVLSRCGVTPRRAVFLELERRYTEPGRFYHTGRHVAECLAALDRHPHLAERPEEVELAVWFHDAVYDARRTDNEERSAELSTRLLSDVGISPESVDRVGDMIRATKSHEVGSGDTAVMLDIDLGMLGQPEDVFARYDQNIRKEYHWVPEAQYRAGRAAVLQSFLDRSTIYFTSDFREALEAQARRNIENRLRQLRSDGT